jgi:predicted transcriptional regulator
MAEAIAPKMADRKVRDFMTQMVITVKEDAPIMECIDHMLNHNVKRVPVLNKGNKVIVMLYERDIFYFVTDAMQNNSEWRHDE